MICPQVYKGYVDDPRNTDNAWTETIAMNFHDDTGKILDGIQLKVGLFFIRLFCFVFCFVFAVDFQALPRFVCLFLLLPKSHNFLTIFYFKKKNKQLTLTSTLNKYVGTFLSGIASTTEQRCKIPLTFVHVSFQFYIFFSFI